jgi:hypothetical protein
LCANIQPRLLSNFYSRTALAFRNIENDQSDAALDRVFEAYLKVLSPFRATPSG